MRQLLGALSLVAILQYFPASVQAQVSVASGLKSDAIQQVIATKWMANYPDGNFYPERMITRAELASILVKTFQLDKRVNAQQGTTLPIKDVSPNSWAFDEVQTVLKTGIMKGYRDNMFFPNQKVTRAEALAIFAQAYGVFQFSDETVNKILARYPDAKSIPDWARRAIATVVSEDFINTDSQGNISPLKPMTRGDMAYVLSRYLQRQQAQPETPEVDPTPNSLESPK